MRGDTLPAGVQREFDAAVQRTGMTPALEHASHVLPMILRLPPSSFEAYCRIVASQENVKKVL